MQIWHNPRCSKSRQTLAIIEEADVSPDIILYLDNPPDEKTLQLVIKQLGITPRELLRKGEAEYKQLGLADHDLSDQAIVDAMVQHPRLIERPIVIESGQAIIGRPPENVLPLLEGI